MVDSRLLVRYGPLPEIVIIFDLRVKATANSSNFYPLERNIHEQVCLCTLYFSKLHTHTHTQPSIHLYKYIKVLIKCSHPKSVVMCTGILHEARSSIIYQIHIQPDLFLIKNAKPNEYYLRPVVEFEMSHYIVSGANRRRHLTNKIGRYILYIINHYVVMQRDIIHYIPRYKSKIE